MLDVRRALLLSKGGHINSNGTGSDETGLLRYTDQDVKSSLGLHAAVWFAKQANLWDLWVMGMAQMF